MQKPLGKDRLRMGVRTSGWPLRAVISVLDKTHGLGSKAVHSTLLNGHLERKS